RNGSATVSARSLWGAVATVPVTVAQRVTAVIVPQDSMRFDALKAVLPVRAVARDRLGAPVQNAVVSYVTGDSSVATADTSGNVRALGNGATTLTASN